MTAAQRITAKVRELDIAEAEVADAAGDGLRLSSSPNFL